MEANPYLQIKTVTPAVIEQDILPDDVYLALSKVIVEGDSNLVSDNIKQGVSIFGVEGTLEVRPPLQEKEVSASTTEKVNVEPDQDYYGLSKVVINQIRLESKVVNPGNEEIVLTPSYGMDGINTVRVLPIVSNAVEVSPDFSSGNVVITPDEGTYINQVTINKDENLKPEYIKEGITINGVTGTYRGEWYTEVVNGTLEIHGDAEVEGGTLDI